MNNVKYRIMVVDDSPSDLHMAISCLKDHYQVVAATNGNEALQLLEKSKIEVVLLDVTMPGMDGYEVCKKIREKNNHIKIIFLSANDGLDEILKGYDAGGNDYVTKPFSPEILLGKIAKSVEFVVNYEKLESEKNDASGAFMTAITSMGDLGGVINFLRSSFKVGTSNELAAILLDCIDSYDLKGSIQLRTHAEHQNYTNGSELTELEAELLTRISTIDERFIENGKRMFINYEKVSVLIKNMPIEDDVKMGRLRDTLAILMEGTNEKQISLEKDKALVNTIQHNNDKYLHLLHDTEQALSYIQTVHHELKHANVNLMEQTVEEIQSTFFHLGLTDAQEVKLGAMLRQSHEKAARLFKESVELEEQIMSILQKLKISETH